MIISLLVTAGTFVLSKYHNRDKMMTQMNKDIQDYYYISCPNGNELDIKQRAVMNINTLFLVILLAQQNTLTNLHSD